MAKESIEIANRFLAEKECSIQELETLKKWLSDWRTQTEVECWLLEHWSMSPEVESATLVETIFEQINEYQSSYQTNKSHFSVASLLKFYQKIAAFLLIPIMVVGILYWMSQYNQSSGQYTETFAPRGQKSQIVLADGT